MFISRWAVLALCVVAMSVPGNAQLQEAPTFKGMLLKNRMEISVKDGKLAGPGGEAIRAATADAQFVLIGEDHGIAQVPLFDAALCTELAPHGFHRLELEISPSVAPALEGFARARDGAAQFVAFNERYPDSIAFYTWREEFEFLQQCAKLSPQGLEIRGLDQDFMGDAKYILTRISEMKLSGNARKTFAKLLEEEKSARLVAEKTGNPGDLFLMTEKEEDLNRARDLLRREGPAEARVLFELLLTSRDIYWKFMNASGYASNRERAMLMKALFRADYVVAEPPGDAPPAKVIFKFGAYHLGRGMNSLHSSEIGDYVSELAEGRGQKSVHIMIIGLKGTQSAFAGIGKPYAEVPLDLAGDPNSQLPFLKPLYDNMLEKSWTVFNIGNLRDHFGAYKGIDPELERIIFAYDYVVVIPDPAASHLLSAAAAK